MNTNIQNFHILVAKFVNQTTTKPHRIKISSERFKQWVNISWNEDNGRDTCEQAENWLKKQGFNIIGHAEGKKHYYIITDTFEPLKPKP